MINAATEPKLAVARISGTAEEALPFEFPLMQRGASFNLDAIKAEMGKRMEQAEAASKGPSN
jgi:hypothetical protein